MTIALIGEQQEVLTGAARLLLLSHSHGSLLIGERADSSSSIDVHGIVHDHFWAQLDMFEP